MMGMFYQATHIAKTWRRLNQSRSSQQAALCSAVQNMTREVRLGLCQLKVTDDKMKNIENASKAVQSASDKGCDLVVLPEMWNCPYSNDSFPTYAEVVPASSDTLYSRKDSPSIHAMSEMAQKCGITLVGGSVPEQENDKLYNTCLVFDKDGKVLAKHRKVHLFDINIPGGITFRESDTLSPGNALTIVDLAGFKIGLGICYDIRFPEMAMLYSRKGAHLILYPGAFNMTTGPVHWELLSKARAVDNQLFVATCSPARNKDSSYQAWGHSTVVGPFGEILATCDHTESTVFATLRVKDLEVRRENMPLNQQRRTDMYNLEEVP